MYAVYSPNPADAGVISELILQSDCGMLTALFGARVQDLLRWLLDRRDNPYSSSHALVVTEVLAGEARGPAIGAMVGALVSTTRAADLRTAAHLARWYGPAVIARLPRLARAGAALEGLRRNDFYLSNIAVLPAQRGRGAGAFLLRAAEHRARGAGAPRLVLDVEAHNDGARAFYFRMGYARESEVGIDLGRHGVFSFLRLARML